VQKMQGYGFTGLRIDELTVVSGSR
jgi:hypothetical protein